MQSLLLAVAVALVGQAHSLPRPLFGLSLDCNCSSCHHQTFVSVHVKGRQKLEIVHGHFLRLPSQFVAIRPLLCADDAGLRWAGITIMCTSPRA
jgi:hypothetical protein